MPSNTALIIGPGALGRFLGFVLHNEGTKVAYAGKKELKTLSQQIADTRPSTIYICTPPEVTDQVWSALFVAFHDKIIFPKNQHIRIIFLNNGFVPFDDIIDQIKHCSEPPTINLTRGLVLAGFLRENKSDAWTDDQHTVRHTGGHLIYYKDIYMTPTQSDDLSQQRDPPGAKSFFTWQWREDIFALEAAKFFTNAILAYFIGPTLRPNRLVNELCPEGPLRQEYAEKFARHFSYISGLTAEILLDTLRQTVENTLENINSVSKSWHQGHVATKDYFFTRCNWNSKVAL